MATPMAEGMQKQMLGSQGTWTGMALQVPQCAFAVACICAVLVFESSDDLSAFWVSICFICTRGTMVLQFQWSVILAGLDIVAIRNKEDLQDRSLVIFSAVLDGIMAVLTFTAASASAGSLTLYVGDVDFCRKVACGQIMLSIVLAFIVSLLAATSFCCMLRLKACLSK